MLDSRLRGNDGSWSIQIKRPLAILEITQPKKPVDRLLATALRTA